jgi:hypothetical protein
VAAGRYRLWPFAPAYTADGAGFPNESEKVVTLSDGETVEGINISLKRGGAITGRVTDASGQPIVEEQIKIQILDERDQKQPFYPRNGSAQRTDDRGVYRIYGLPAGRYIIGAGVEMKRGEFRMGYGTRYYPLTFYPGSTDESKATVIELPQGGEVTGVDMTLGRVEKSYTATGRLVDADTGKPVADVSYGYGPMSPDQPFLGSVMYGFRSDAKGVLRLEGLLPGRYAAFVNSTGDSEYYSDPTVFEITDGNVSGIEVRVRRGSSISGTVVIEGAADPNLLAKFPSLTLHAYFRSTQEMSVHRSYMIKIKPDGSFLMAGLAPGKVQIELPGWSRPKELSLLRMERNGVEQREGIDVSTGEQVSGVKVVLAYGTGIIRGQIKIEGMDYPEDARMSIDVLRTGVNEQDNIQTEVDSRGRFVIEGLAPGEYELTVGGLIFRSRTSPVHLKPATQVVTVTNGAELEMTFVLKPVEKDN